jgi:DNA helicase HerA-like ATPase
MDDLMQSVSGRGVVSILAADKLLSSPRVYSTLLLWLLSELFENLPEIGDPEKPRLVFFFDEAHLLFNDAPRELLERIEQVVRLVRSKGVGVYFVTQNPLDVPQTVLGQLGNRVQHALRAFTPRDQQAVRAAATTFRANPKLDVEKVIGELAVGEALVSFLDEKGRPAVVERAFVIPPGSRLGPLTPEERRKLMEGSLVAGHYEKTVDRESAHEQLAARAGGKVKDAPPAKESAEGSIFDRLGGGNGSAPKGRTREGPLEAAAKSAARAIGSEVGRRIIRGVLGSILGGKR